MVRRIVVASIGLTAFGLLALVACQKLNFPPSFKMGAVPDSVQVIDSLPASGSVAISKNGYRVFDLDAIVDDEDDPDSTISWTLTPGPLLLVTLHGDTADIGPTANQIGESYVVFTATDPGGLSWSQRCSVSVFDEFEIVSPVTESVSVGGTANIPIAYDYRSALRPLLEWGAPAFDNAWLTACRVEGASASKKLILTAGSRPGTTGVQLDVTDPVNHVTFHHGVLIVIQ
jgi:hypothetical protein